MNLILENIVFSKFLIMEIIIAIKRSKEEKKDFIIINELWTFFFSDENIYIEKLDEFKFIEFTEFTELTELKSTSFEYDLVAKNCLKQNTFKISYEKFLIFMKNEILQNEALFRDQDIRDTCKLLTCILANLEFLM